LDLDLALQVKKHVVIIDASSNEEKAHYRHGKGQTDLF